MFKPVQDTCKRTRDAEERIVVQEGEGAFAEPNATKVLQRYALSAGTAPPTASRASLSLSQEFATNRGSSGAGYPRRNGANSVMPSPHSVSESLRTEHGKLCGDFSSSRSHGLSRSAPFAIFHPPELLPESQESPPHRRHDNNTTRTKSNASYELHENQPKDRVSQEYVQSYMETRPLYQEQMSSIRSRRSRYRRPETTMLVVEDPLESIPAEDQERYCQFLFGRSFCQRDETRFVVSLDACKKARGDRRWTRSEHSILVSIQHLGIYLGRCEHSAVRMSFSQSIQLTFDGLLTLINAFPVETFCPFCSRLCSGSLERDDWRCAECGRNAQERDLCARLDETRTVFDPRTGLDLYESSEVWPIIDRYAVSDVWFDHEDDDGSYQVSVYRDGRVVVSVQTAGTCRMETWVDDVKEYLVGLYRRVFAREGAALENRLLLKIRMTAMLLSANPAEKEQIARYFEPQFARILRSRPEGDPDLSYVDNAHRLFCVLYAQLVKWSAS